MAHDDRPRVHLSDPLRPGFGTIGEPNPAMARAGLHESGRGRWVGPGRGAIGDGCRRPTDGLGLGGHWLRKCPHDLAERTADRIGRIARVVVAVENCHDQAEGFRRAEHQRR